MTPDELKRFFPNASRSCAARNQAGDSGLRPDNPEPTQGNALVCSAPRKGKGRKGAVLGVARRHRISIRIFSMRPADWDGYSVKELQDCLVHAGLLDDDAWNCLSGEVLSEKAHSKEEERTEIEIA